jgi:hypothetical protein
MWRYGACAVLGGLVLSSLSSCFVGSFDKVDNFGGAGGGGSGTGGVGAAASGGSPAGGAGGGGTCDVLECEAAAEGEKACCFSNPAFGSVCGRSVDDYPLNETCLPLDSPGDLDSACPSVVLAGRTLEGCCLGALGICGVEDPEHPDLGCVPGEAVGQAFQPCGMPSCGTLCQSALVNGCLQEGDLAVYACALTCTDHSATCPDELTAVAECVGGFDECSGTGFAIAEGCETEYAALESCWGNEDCATYCSAINATCIAEGAQYESDGQCLAVCNEIATTFDTVPGIGDNTLSCRLEQLAAGSAAACAAAGPAGETNVGVCGTACQTFCVLGYLVCTPEFEGNFMGGLPDCETFCSSNFEESPPYATTGNADGSAECRILHLARMLVTPAPTQCGEVAVGGIVDCPP